MSEGRRKIKYGRHDSVQYEPRMPPFLSMGPIDEEECRFCDWSPLYMFLIGLLIAV